MEPGRQPGVQRSMRRLNPMVIALVGVIVLILVVWLVAGTRNADQDKLTGNVVTAQSTSDPEKGCSAQATYDMLKRELFRRAAQQRGSDQATYDELSSAASLRVEDPAMESQDSGTGAVNCTGSVSVDLPPGVTAADGRTSLMSDVDYAVQKAADGSGDVVVLKNADALVEPLSRVVRTQQATQPDETNQADEQPDVAQDGSAAQAPVPPPPGIARPAAPVTPRPATARPSFDCANARTSGETAVCSDAGLAALDRSMAAQYGRAAAGADPDQLQLLQETRSRFLRYRDRCQNKACIGDAYTGRMREIHDIMAGTWQPPR